MLNDSMGKIICFITLLLLLSGRLFATTYYVDPQGSDNNNGTSPASPWATLKKVNSSFYNPGDEILFLKGGVWNGALVMNSSGTAQNPILWGSYGVGANPLISGFVTASGWKDTGSGIWSYSNPQFGTSTPGIVTIDGKVQPLGRYPKASYNIYTGHSGSTSITDNKFGSALNFTGGEVVIRTAHFVWTRGKITSQAGGTIQYSSSSTYPPVNGYQYFIQNHKNCLTQFGDWCYDTATKTVYMYFGAGATPANYKVKISNQAILVNFKGIYNNSCNAFAGIDFEGADMAFQGLSADYTSISNCNISAIGDNAIDFGYSNNLTITGNTITDCNNDGIACWYGTRNTVINSNILTRIGMIAGAGENDTGGLYNKGAYTGIAISDIGLSNTNTIRYNSIVQTGYNGIEINGDSYVVDENFVNYPCSLLDDGGGIYTYTGPITITYKGRTISNNIVLNSTGNDLFDYKAADGIYLDDFSANVTVTGNTVANCEAYGYFLHNCHNVSVSKNLSYNNGISQLLLQYDNTLLNGTNKQLNIQNNMWAASSAGQLGLQFQSVAYGSSNTDFAQAGVSDNNHYGSLAKNNLLINAAINWNGGSNLNLPNWSAVSKKDLHSTELMPAYTSVDFEYNNTLTNKTLNLTGVYQDIAGNNYTGTVILAPFSSLLLLGQTPNCSIAKPVIQWQ